MSYVEEWRSIPGYEGSYAVSSEGIVLSLERRCDFVGGTRRVRKRVLKVTRRPKVGKPQSCIVKLSRPDQKGEYFTIAKLLLLAFVGPPSNGQVAHYKDGDCTNGVLANVEWSDYSEIAIQSGYKRPVKRRRVSHD
jgi:hypothetical protein